MYAVIWCVTWCRISLLCGFEADAGNCREESFVLFFGFICVF